MIAVPGFTPTVQDWHDYMEYVRRGPNRWRAALVYVLPVAVAAMTFFLQWRSGSEFPWFLPLLLGCALLFLLLYLQRHQGSQLAKSSLHGAARSVTIDADGLEVRTATGVSRLFWHAVKEVTVHKGVLVVWVGFEQQAGIGVMVPRSAFTAQADFDAFVAEARRLWDAARPQA